MVWVCPPHTSMNLYWRPGSHCDAMRALRARALAASRNSSTYFMPPSFFDRLVQQAQLLVVGVADGFEELEGGAGLLLVDLRHGEPDVDEHPVTRLHALVLQQPDVDGPRHTAHV